MKALVTRGRKVSIAPCLSLWQKIKRKKELDRFFFTLKFDADDAVSPSIF